MKRLLGYTLLMIGFLAGCKSHPCEAVEVHADWSDLELPLGENGVVCQSDEAGNMVHYSEGSQEEWLATYGAAMMLAGWKKDPKVKGNESNLYFVKGKKRVNVNVYDYEGTGLTINKTY